MAADTDQRVIPAVLAALVALEAPTPRATLRRRASPHPDVVVRDRRRPSGLARSRPPRCRRALAKAYERAADEPDLRGARRAAGGARRARSPGGGAAARTRASAIATGPSASARRRCCARIDAAARRRADAAGAADAGAARAERLDAHDRAAGLADGVHRYRERDDSDRARGARRAAHGGQLHLAGAAQLPRRRRRSIASSRTSSCRTAIRAATAKAARATRFATRSISGRICAARSGWRSTGKTPAAASSSSRISPQPHLDGRYTVFGRVVAGMEVVDALQQWDQIRTVRIWDGANGGSAAAQAVTH